MTKLAIFEEMKPKVKRVLFSLNFTL